MYLSSSSALLIDPHVPAPPSLRHWGTEDAVNCYQQADRQTRRPAVLQPHFTTSILSRAEQNKQARVIVARLLFVQRTCPDTSIAVSCVLPSPQSSITAPDSDAGPTAALPVQRDHIPEQRADSAPLDHTLHPPHPTTAPGTIFRATQHSVHTRPVQEITTTDYGLSATDIALQRLTRQSGVLRRS